MPTLKAATGSDWTMAAWRGIVGAQGHARPTCATSWLAALKKVATSKEYNDFMASRGFGVIYAGRTSSRTFMAKSDADLGATMKAVGIAK